MADEYFVELREQSEFDGLSGFAGLGALGISKKKLKKQLAAQKAAFAASQKKLAAQVKAVAAQKAAKIKAQEQAKTYKAQVQELSLVAQQLVDQGLSVQQAAQQAVQQAQAYQMPAPTYPDYSQMYAPAPAYQPAYAPAYAAGPSYQPQAVLPSDMPVYAQEAPQYQFAPPYGQQPVEYVYAEKPAAAEEQYVEVPVAIEAGPVDAFSSAASWGGGFFGLGATPVRRRRRVGWTRRLSTGFMSPRGGGVARGFMAPRF